MKTRQEMIYEFMLALASNSNACDSSAEVDNFYYGDIADRIVLMASTLADKVLEKAK